MKSVNLNAQKVLNILTAGLNTVKRSNRSRKVNNDGMTVSIELLEESIIGSTYRIAHYSEQNETNTEMIVLKGGDDKYYPIYLKINDCSRYSADVDMYYNTIKCSNPKMQKDDAVFMGKWMSNIKNQQGLKKGIVLK